jgi:carbon monoxide dehydrogenase subunit G
MLTVEESIVIDKPRAEVSDFFANPDNTAVYSSNLVDYQVVSGGPQEIGRQAKFSVKVLGVRLDYTDELVEFVEGEHAKLVSKEGRIPYAITLNFTDEGAGTKVTWLQESESLGSVFKLADGLVMKIYSKDVRANLEKAKAILEG